MTDPATLEERLAKSIRECAVTNCATCHEDKEVLATLTAQAERIATLTRAVQEAYEEGWHTGHRNGRKRGGWYGSACGDWEHSSARRALGGAE